MTIVLSPHEARVIGCLMEKEVTTPEHYPLSLNALTAACNQKSNRDPVMDLDEATVREVVDGLMKRHLVSDRAGYGGRVAKYKQAFCNTALGPLQFTPLERAIVCELLVRGPQTPGELRTRCQRMAPPAEVPAVEAALTALAAHELGPFVVKLPRASGMRDSRWAHLLGGEVTVPAAAVEEPPARAAGTGLAERVAQLEDQVARLQRELGEIRERLGQGEGSSVA